MELLLTCYMRVSAQSDGCVWGRQSPHCEAAEGVYLDWKWGEFQATVEYLLWKTSCKTGTVELGCKTERLSLENVTSAVGQPKFCFWGHPKQLFLFLT